MATIYGKFGGLTINGIDIGKFTMSAEGLKFNCVNIACGCKPVKHTTIVISEPITEDELTDQLNVSYERGCTPIVSESFFGVDLADEPNRNGRFYHLKKTK
jgi:hypothetical protein